MKVMVTGGTGYVGSHVVTEIQSAGMEAVIYDNLSNSSGEVVERIGRITGQTPEMLFGEMENQEELAGVLADGVEAVIHCAGLKAVGESVQKPLQYYRANVGGTVSLLDAMKFVGVDKVIFSSSATVYGDPTEIPVTESSTTTAPANPYGWTKLMIEQILTDTQRANPQLSVGIMRYFNPVGAHPSGLIGESPSGVPNNLTPYIGMVAAGEIPELPVYGDDYPTPDGTGVRDYLHVVDLAQGHLAALRYLSEHGELGIWNLGTGTGTSVYEMIECFETTNGVKVPYRIFPRRAGDIAACWADPSRAEQQLGWKAKRSLAEMCADLWRWQQQGP